MTKDHILNTVVFIVLIALISPALVGILDIYLWLFGTSTGWVTWDEKRILFAIMTSIMAWPLFLSMAIG